MEAVLKLFPKCHNSTSGGDSDRFLKGSRSAAHLYHGGFEAERLHARFHPEAYSPR